MSLLLFVLLLFFGGLRSILPISFQQLLVRLEYPYANFVFCLGGGVDDAVSSFIEKNEVVYKPEILRVVLVSEPESEQQSSALLHLMTFLDDLHVRNELEEYSLTRATPEIKKEIESMLSDVPVK